MPQPFRLHLEPTTRCTAICAQCLRRSSPPELFCRDMDLKLLKSQVPISNVSEVDLCGNFGDPMCYPYIRELVGLFHRTSVDKVRIHTNGFGGSKEFWADMAVYSSKVEVIFAIDGIGEIHELNRVGTHYATVIANARTLIDNGGNATWYMLVFKHNEHQVLQCRDIAKRFGFTKFVAKTSDRFFSYVTHDSYDAIPVDNHVIEPTTRYPRPELTVMNRASTQRHLRTTGVTCWFPGSIYIDARMRVFPCCITAAAVSGNKLGLDHTDYFLRKYGDDSIRLTPTRSLHDVIHGAFFREFQKTLTANNAQVGCKVCCGSLPCLPRTVMTEIFR